MGSCQVKGHWTMESSPDAFGPLYDSTPDSSAPATLRKRLREDGYVFLRNVVAEDELARLREVVVETLCREDARRSGSAESALNTAAPCGRAYRVLHELGNHPAALEIVRNANLVNLFSRLFTGPAISMDHVWIRACGTAQKSDVHCDWVYMSRGSRRVLSAWMPLVDIPTERGALMILERSHHDAPHTREYLKLDADRLGLLYGLRWKHGRLIWGGRYSTRPDRVWREFGTRWLTCSFRVGDMVVFDARCVHATLPNLTNDLRLSIDARYQPACDPVDPRFAGPAPAVHSEGRKHLLHYAQRLAMRFSALLG
jgi:ectoine hydroxylase-related dioxygenase (phytanoyl-CoA dioxygenase family)